MLQKVAVHECAHAVVGHLRGQFVRESGLTASDAGEGLAHVRSPIIIPRNHWERTDPAALAGADAAAEWACAMCLAGYVAERRFSGDSRWSWAQWDKWAAAAGSTMLRWGEHSDYPNAIRIVNDYLGRPQLPPEDDPAVLLYVSALEDFTRRILRRPKVWNAVLGLAQMLCDEGGYLEGDVASDYLEARLPGSWLPYGVVAGGSPRPVGILGDGAVRI